MPHIRLEYSDNILEKDSLIPVLKKAQDILVEMLPAGLASCKSAAVPYEVYLVGDGDVRNCFASMNIKIKAGRSPETVGKAGELLLNLMEESFARTRQAKSLSLSVEIEELSQAYFHSNN